MNTNAVLCATAIVLLAVFGECTGSTATPSAAGKSKGESKPPDSPDPNKETCYMLSCIAPYATFLNTLILGKQAYQWTITQYPFYTYAISYIAVSYDTKISDLKAAFETCIKLKQKSRVECENFFNEFFKKGYPIDRIFDFCSRHEKMCEDPSKIPISYATDRSLGTIDNLKFKDCLANITEEHKQIESDNLRLGYVLSQEKTKDQKANNRCTCHQIAALGKVFRLLGVWTTSDGYFQNFDDFLKGVCIVISQTSPPVMVWTPKWALEIGNQIKRFGIAIINPLDLAKEILLRDRDIYPAMEVTDLGWTVKYIVTVAHDSAVNPRNYKEIVDLIAQATLRRRSAKEFESFWRATNVFCDSIISKFRPGTDRLALSTHPLYKVTLKLQFMEIWKRNFKQNLEILVNGANPGNTFLNEILGFFTANYRLK